MIRRIGAALLIGYLIFVVYGSLVPLDFSPLPFDQAWQRFQATPYLQLGVESRADWIANGVLYTPLGFLVTWQLMHAGWARWASAGMALAMGVALAVGVEFAQVFFPPRTVSRNDLLAECIGLVVGAAFALACLRQSSVPAMAQRAVPWLRAHGLQVYAAAYVAYSLFPYDLLISRVELEQKLDSDLWGWWLAGLGARPLLVALQSILEAALAVPLGLLLGQRASAHATPSLGRAAAIGLAIGMAIEVAQLFIASGVTQGASVLSRAVGVVAGLLLWRRRRRLSLERVRMAALRHVVVCAAAYLLLLVAVNGWFSFAWQGPGAALAQWRDIRFLPFYYHYFTTEAHALTSLSSVAVMYLPVGVTVWALRRSATTAAVCGAVLCLLIETSKLWLAGLHPDPTNLLIAAAACWGFVAGAEAWAQRTGAVAPDPVHSERAAPRAPAGTRFGSGAAGGAALLGVVLLAWLLQLLSAPAFAAGSALLLAGCAAVVWLRPRAAMLLVPAMLPILDLTPWTGRFFWDEFDVLLTVCLGVGYLRCPAPPERAALGPWHAAFALLASSLAISAALGAMPWPRLDANSLASYYYSPYNALRIVKGMVWAALFLGLLHRLQRSGLSGVRRAVASGMALGLAYVVLFVMWERLVFVSLFDFSDDYRVTGPFSAMHRGGAFIECYIAVAVPFVLVRVIETRRWAVRFGGAAVLLGASYAMMVTFSRNGYAAFAVALLLLLSLSRADGSRRRAWVGGALAVAIVAVALPVLLGSFAQQRLARSLDDLALRQAHWADALAMRDNSLSSSIFGMGLGRFPVTHFWFSREPVHAASFRLDAEEGKRYLRLAGGQGGLYIEQLVARSDAGPLRLMLRLRSNKPADVLALSLCEKWMLTSRTCVHASVSTGTPGAWNDVETAIDIAPLSGSGGPMSRPLKFALHTPAVGSVVDVTGLSLQDAFGRELLSNADFAAGVDRWFFSTDIDPPWHIHSLPLTILFEQGWLGVLAWTGLIAVALRHGARQAWHGDRHAAAAVAALLAFLVSGLFNTLIDEPRFLFLLLLVAGLCCTRQRRGLVSQHSALVGEAVMQSGSSSAPTAIASRDLRQISQQDLRMRLRVED